MIRTILVGLALVAAVSLTLMASPLNAQTPILVQHKLSGDSVCSGMSTCTVTLNSPTVAGHALLLGIAGAGFGGFPVASSPVGDSAWTHCPNAIGQYESDSTDWIFTDCYYILSAAGGATSISVTLTGQTAAQIENMDVDVMEVTCTTACLASYDASNNVVDSGNCSTCASETLALTGSNDAILQIGNFVEQFVSVASPYSVLDSDSVSANAFAYWLNGNSGASVNWRQNSAQQAVFAGLALKFSSPPPGTTFYISSGIGSDSNNGTTKTTPWAHLPGMVNCSSNCAAYSPGAGDQFILRGGDAWASSSLGINWQWSGTSSFPIYIGVDQTWYGGNSWTRPVWSCGGASCSGTGPQANFFNTGSSYVTVDNIEVTGLYSSAPSLANYFNVYGANDIFEHIYAHGWSHAAASTGTPDSSSVFNFNPAYATTGDAVHDSVIDGTDTTQDSMGCFTGALPAAYNNVCEYVTNGFEGAGSNIHDNWFGPIVTSFVFGQNQNALLQFGPDNSATSAFIYNNVIANSTCAACGGVVKLGLSANNANTATGYAFNNVLFNNAQGNYLSLGGHSAVNYGTWNFFNNTLECGTDAATGPCGSDANGASGMSFVFHSQNNHYVTSASPANSCSFSTCSSTTDLTQPVSAANTQGYTSTSTYALQPTSGLGATISAGTNSQSLCTTIAGLNSAAGTACLADTSYACNYVTGNHTVNCPDRNENARPASSAWDVGAYQAIVAPAIITQPSNQTVSSGQTATFTVVAGGTAPLTYQWLENNATIMGATSASYTTPPTTTANTGEQFTVVVTNGVSSVTSSPAATLVVSTPTTLTMTAAPTSSTYGQSVTLTATLSPVTAGSFTNAGETIVFQDFGTTVGTGTINSSGVATITLTKMPAITNNLVAYYLGDSDFLPSNSATLHFPVNPAVLTVTAQSVSRPFGAANPAFTATYSGFVNGDSQTSATTGAPSLTTTATSTSPAGTYPITASTGTLAAPNYTFSFVAGTLTVTQGTGSTSNVFIQKKDQYFGNGSGVASESVVFNSNVTSADLLFCTVGWDVSGSGSISSVTDSLGNSYASLPLVVHSPHQMQGFYTFSNSSGADAVTVRFNGTGGTYVGIACGEWSGPTNLDVHGEASGLSATPASASISPSASGELLIGYADDSSNTWAASGAWTLRSTSVSVRYGLEDQLSSGTIPVAAGFTINSDPWTAGIIAFGSSTPIGGSTGSGNTSNMFIQKTDQYFGNRSGVASESVVFNSNVTSADLLFCTVGWDVSGSGSISSVTDSLGNSYASLPLVVHSPHQMQGFYAFSNGSGADAVTVRFNGTGGTYVGIACGEWSGPTNLDVHGEASGLSATPASASISPSASGELLIGYADDSSNTWAASGAWTLRSTSVSVRYGLEDQLSSGTIPVAAGFTINSDPWTAGIVAFNSSTGNGGSPGGGNTNNMFIQKADQYFGNESGVTSESVVFNSNVTNSDLLFCTVGWDVGGGASVTDSLGNSYAALPLVAHSPHQMQGFYAFSKGSGADAVTVSFSGTGGTYVGMACGEWSGPTHLDVHGEASGTSAMPASASITPSASGELLIGYADDSVNTWTASGGWTLRSTSGSVRYGLEDQLNSGTTPVAAGFTIASDPWTAGIVAFGGSTSSESTNNMFIQKRDQYFGNESGAASESVVFNSNVTSANLLFCTVGWDVSGSGSISSVTDSLGNSYAALPSVVYSPHQMQGFYAFSNGSGADAVTVSFNGTGGTYVGIACGEWSGPTYLDVHGEASGTSATPASTSITPSASGELLIGYADDSVNTWTASGAWTLRSTSGSVRYGLEDQLSSKTAPVAAGFTITSDPWTAGIVAFGGFTNVTQNFIPAVAKAAQFSTSSPSSASID